MGTPGAGMSAIRASSAKFASELFAVVREGKTNRNVVISPLSLQIVLAVVYTGAGGKTKSEIGRALHLDGNDADAVKSYAELLANIKDPALCVASALFVDQTAPVLPAFQTAVTSNFKAEVLNVDFKDSSGASRAINDWCSKNTNGKIAQLMSPGELVDTLTVITNAIHFKADWKKKFNASATFDADFNAPSGPVKVKMMYQSSKFNYGVNEKIGAQVVELPYAGDKFRMVIILPFESTNLDKVEEKLRTVPLHDVLRDMFETTVNLSLPKFKLEIEASMEDSLPKMGIVDLFEAADLRGISDRALKVSKIKQKVYIHVDEQGTEAAAATAAVVMLRSMTFKEDFLVNRPFGVVVLDQLGLPLFVGSIYNPADVAAARDEL